jgi:hypothetical protein
MHLTRRRFFQSTLATAATVTVAGRDQLID